MISGLQLLRNLGIHNAPATTSKTNTCIADTISSKTYSITTGQAQIHQHMRNSGVFYGTQRKFLYTSHTQKQVFVEIRLCKISTSRYHKNTCKKF